MHKQQEASLVDRCFSIHVNKCNYAEPENNTIKLACSSMGRMKIYKTEFNYCKRMQILTEIFGVCFLINTTQTNKKLIHLYKNARLDKKRKQV